ncbi:zinc finger BED domain-containing protein 4 [Misgurnus anguillicaudatus]|uniref:zinc finger BED domain-containing protein 4 n=1 Tax=Misgurnus anguillicaudatus TaxID=75329 RepID=UPI003CCFBB08
MASKSRVSILDYFNIVCEGENGKIESNCKACGTRIQAKRTVTSNFVTHLKRKHQAMYDEFVRKKDVKREAMQTCAGPPTGRVIPQSGTGMNKFDYSDPRQSLISEAIAKMIIRDLQPAQIVEYEGFRELLQLLEPRYTPIPCHYIQQQLLPAYVSQVQQAAKQALKGAESCSVTLDTLSVNCGYLGVTCHFINTDWNIRSALLACLPLPGHSNTQQMLSEFDEISESHGISGKVFRVVADSSPSEKRSAFRLPGFHLMGNGEEDEEGEDDSSDEEAVAGGIKEAVSSNENHKSLDHCLGQSRIDCFARLLAQCVKEGVCSSPQISVPLSKAAHLYNYVNATVAPEKLLHVFGSSSTLAGEQESSSTDKYWTAQLKIMRQMVESMDFLEDIVDRNDLVLGSLEKAVLQELVEVLEPFEEASDMVSGDKHVSISLALPCVLGLRKHLAEVTTQQCSGIVMGLSQALERRLAGILEDPLFVTATTLDPQFKLSWSSDTDWHKQVLLEEVGKHTQPLSPLEHHSEAQPSPSKRCKLFSFIKQRPTTQAKTVEQELSTYLHEEPTDEDPLQYWKRKSIDFPLLSQVAKKVFTVPATTTSVDQIFNLVSKTLAPQRCQYLPKNLDTLIYLKANYKILWS